jgi:hypothetical protein
MIPAYVVVQCTHRAHTHRHTSMQVSCASARQTVSYKSPFCHKSPLCYNSPSLCTLHASALHSTCHALDARDRPAHLLHNVHVYDFVRPCERARGGGSGGGGWGMRRGTPRWRCPCGKPRPGSPAPSGARPMYHRCAADRFQMYIYMYE